MSPQDWTARIASHYEAAVARGEHDDECEYSIEEGYCLCHCSKRRREAAGFTEPPTDNLEFPPPWCPHCREELDHDGDCFRCYACSLSWDSNGQGHTARFTDDYGDISRCAAHGIRGHWVCERATASEPKTAGTQTEGECPESINQKGALDA